MKEWLESVGDWYELAYVILCEVWLWFWISKSYFDRKDREKLREK